MATITVTMKINIDGKLCGKEKCSHFEFYSSWCSLFKNDLRRMGYPLKRGIGCLISTGEYDYDEYHSWEGQK